MHLYFRELNGNLPNLVGICTQDLGSETATSKAINLESGVLDITNDESKNLKIHDLERKDLDNSDFLKSQDILENSDALDVLDVDQADTLDNTDVLDNSNVLNKSDAFEISEVNDNLKGTEDLKSNNDSLDNSNVLDSSENLTNTKIFESSEDVNNLENKENLENSKRSKMAFLMGVYTSRCNSSMEVFSLIIIDNFSSPKNCYLSPKVLNLGLLVLLNQSLIFELTISINSKFGLIFFYT